jgi:hypothetical protein
MIKGQVETKPFSHGLIGRGIGQLADDGTDGIGRQNATDHEGDDKQDEKAEQQMPNALRKLGECKLFHVRNGLIIWRRIS